MPAIFHIAFPVRYYECDAYGHVNNANYLRYMQEAAFAASAAVGYDAARYAAMGRIWNIYATDIEYLRPLTYGETAQVTTWVEDFRRVSSRRRYEIRSVQRGDVVARALSDWVFLEWHSGKPAVIPIEVRDAFFPEGAPSDFPTRAPFPKAPSPPAGAFVVQRRVQWREIDTAQHANNAVYAEWAEECGMACIAHFGWGAERLAREGLGIFYRRMWIEYLQPAKLNDTLEIVAWLSEVRRATARRHFLIRRAADGATLARVNILAACVRIQDGQITRWPERMLKDMQPNIADVAA